MKKSNHQGSVLKDHKQVGRKLIPPMMQLPNMKETSFRDNTLPCLVWMSAIFLRANDRMAVHFLTEFLVKCKDILDDEKMPPLAFLNNFNKLSKQDKDKIIAELNDDAMLQFLRENLEHQHHLLKEYPLSFLFDDYPYGVDKDDALNLLKEDVDALLDRYTSHSTKVQTTAMVSMAATGKLFFGPKIDIPDFNAIFTDPDSKESKRVASFVRCNLNAGAGFGAIEGGKNEWSDSFWKDVFLISECE